MLLVLVCADCTNCENCENRPVVVNYTPGLPDISLNENTWHTIDPPKVHRCPEIGPCPYCTEETAAVYNENPSKKGTAINGSEFSICENWEDLDVND